MGTTHSHLHTHHTHAYPDINMQGVRPGQVKTNQGVRKYPEEPVRKLDSPKVYDKHGNDITHYVVVQSNQGTHMDLKRAEMDEVDRQKYELRKAKERFEDMKRRKMEETKAELDRLDQERIDYRNHVVTQVRATVDKERNRPNDPHPTDDVGKTFVEEVD